MTRATVDLLLAELEGYRPGCIPNHTDPDWYLRLRWYSYSDCGQAALVALEEGIMPLTPDAIIFAIPAGRLS